MLILNIRKSGTLSCSINPSNHQIWAVKATNTNREFCCKHATWVTLQLKQAHMGFYSLLFSQRQKEIKLSSNISSCWHWDSSCRGGEAIWAISEMTSSIQQPFEAWYTNCENKRAHNQSPAGEEAHHCTRATHTHTHTHKHTQGWPPPTAACDDISKTSEKQDNCFCQPSCTHGQQTEAGVCAQVCVCVCVCVHKSNRIWLNQQACPLLSAVMQSDPCIQSDSKSKQSIKETGSGSMSWHQIDAVHVVQMLDSAPSDCEGRF